MPSFTTEFATVKFSLLIAQRRRCNKKFFLHFRLHRIRSTT